MLHGVCVCVCVCCTLLLHQAHRMGLLQPPQSLCMFGYEHWHLAVLVAGKGLWCSAATLVARAAVCGQRGGGMCVSRGQQCMCVVWLGVGAQPSMLTMDACIPHPGACIAGVHAHCAASSGAHGWGSCAY